MMKGKKGQNQLQFTRVVPKFLQKYEKKSHSINSKFEKEQETDEKEDELDEVQAKAIAEYKKSLEEEEKEPTDTTTDSTQQEPSPPKRKSRHEVLKEVKIEKQSKKRKTIQKVQNSALLSFDLDEDD